MVLQIPQPHVFCSIFRLQKMVQVEVEIPNGKIMKKTVDKLFFSVIL